MKNLNYSPEVTHHQVDGRYMSSQYRRYGYKQFATYKGCEVNYFTKDNYTLIRMPNGEIATIDHKANSEDIDALLISAREVRLQLGDASRIEYILESLGEKYISYLNNNNESDVMIKTYEMLVDMVDFKNAIEKEFLYDKQCKNPSIESFLEKNKLKTS